MKYGKLLLLTVINLALHRVICLPEWNFVSYMQADNNLCEYARGNVELMKTVGSSPDVNVLVQMDVPEDQITHRMRIQSKKENDDDSDPDHEMGYHPEEEILIAIKDWVYTKYPAKRLFLNLWNHGGGAVDEEATRKGSTTKNNSTRIGLFARKNEAKESRGILFDDSQGTYLSTPDLGDTCAKIADFIGHKIDILGMDACLMAMIEDAYEFHGSVDHMVASEQTIPGTGWPYDAILSTLASKPTMSNQDFASSIVDAYAALYTKNKTDNFTLSAINVNLIEPAVAAFKDFADAVRAGLAANPRKTASDFKIARQKTLVIDYDFWYVDLVDFYDNIITQFTPAAGYFSLFNKPSATAKAIIAAATKAKDTALAAITHSAAGPQYKGKACGMSIYFPPIRHFQPVKIEPLYKNTLFARETSWPELLETIGSQA